MILVTGATGLVGGNLIWHLLQGNERIRAIRRNSSNMDSIHTIFRFYSSVPDEYLSRIDWITADVLDENSISEAMRGISVVYHCAAVVSFNKDASILTDTNVSGTRNVVRAALENHVHKLCFVSSIAACGKGQSNEKVNENSVWIDSPERSSYSLSKHYSEQEVWKGIKDGLNAVIVNPGVILGVSGTISGSSQLFSQVQKGFMFYTKGGSGYVDVRDVVKAMIQLVQSDISGERFILTGENCSNKDILCWMADGFGKRRPFICIGKQLLWVAGCFFEIAGKIFHFHPLINRNTARTATSREYYSSLKIENTLNFKFTTIEKSIHEICQFMLLIKK
jgi:nucleoside-diphosphate-sugar epimerase